MKILLILLLSLTIFAAKGQVTNSTSKTSKNIYCNAVDTLVSMVIKNGDKNKIYIVSDKFILDRLPDSISNQVINKEKELKGSKQTEGAYWIIVDRLNVSGMKLIIDASIRKQMKKQMISLESNISSYSLEYCYDTTANAYRFINIRKVIFIR